MSTETQLDELRVRLQLAQSSATLLLAVAESEVAVDETRRILLEILRATPLEVADLGTARVDAGPARWAELTREQASPAYVLAIAAPAPPAAALAMSAFAHRVNAQREWLRQLAGPLVLVISRATERALRLQAPDFFTWAAQGYALPAPGDLLRVASKLGVSPQSVRPLIPAETPVRFLHISDIHLRPQRVKRYDQDRVLQGLISFLERDRADFALDLIFVTGDLAQSGKPDEYDLVLDFLRKVMEVTSVPAERVFIVPGNHDVNREVGRWLLRTLSKDEESIAFFEEPASRTFHEQKFAAYKEKMGSLFGAERRFGLGVGGDAVEIIDLKGARLAVASFNSAWFAQGDDDNGKLWLGDASVVRAIDRIADEEALFAVALMHHPFEYLHEVDRDIVERWFEKGFDLVLRGHLHNNKARSIAGQRGGFVEVAAPAAYQGSQWGNGCFLGEIRPRARTVRLRPYTYSSGPDPWVLDAKVFPDDEKEGYCRTFTVPEKRRTKSAVARPLRRAAEEAVRAAPPAEQRQITQQLSGAIPGIASSKNVDRAAATARLLADSPELSEALGKGSIGLTLANAIIQEVTAEASGVQRIKLMDGGGFENALLRAGRAFLKVTSALGLRRERLTIDNAKLALGVALGALVDSVVAIGPMLIDGGRPDILMARTGPSTAGDVIELKRVIPGRASIQRTTEAGLAQLDRYLPTARSAHGALILLGALPPDATEPLIEHAETPAGHDVLVIHL